MEASLRAVDTTWRPTSDCQTIRDFFQIVVASRDRNRFEIHGSGNYAWDEDDTIVFVEQKSGIVCVEAVLEEYVVGAYASGDQTTKGHFFLKSFSTCVNDES